MRLKWSHIVQRLGSLVSWGWLLVTMEGKKRGCLHSMVFLARKPELVQAVAISPVWSRMLCHCCQLPSDIVWDKWSGVSLVLWPKAPISMVAYLAFSPCLCRSLVISRYGLFCCFCSLASLIASLELPLTVSTSMVMFGPLMHQWCRWIELRNLSS